MAQDLNRSIKIYIDNADASLKAEQLRSKVEKLNAELSELANTEGKNSNIYKQKEKSFQSATKSLNTYNEKVRQTTVTLQNLSGATQADLIRTQRELRNSLKTTERGTDEYRSKLLLLKNTEKELSAVNKEMRAEIGHLQRPGHIEK